MRVSVTGAGGFIGNHLVNYLKKRGFFIRGVDIKQPKWSNSQADEFEILDLRYRCNAEKATKNMDWVFNLAADMGGAGFVFTGSHDAEIIRNNTFINVNMLEAARNNNVERFLFSSSACIYPEHLQEKTIDILLKETDAYPASPDSIYGWEKLHGEHLCTAFREAGWLDTRIVRFHNVYGPEGEWRGGREKAPAAMCRKIAIAKLTGNPEIEIWGDGKQRRSFMYIDDCLKGLLKLMESDYHAPINLGRNRAVSINKLVGIIAEIAEMKIKKLHIDGPQGVRFRNSDNTSCLGLFGWIPEIALEQGMVPTYKWIEKQCQKSF